MVKCAKPVRVAFEAEALQQLISSLKGRGYRVVGPVLRDGAITYESLESSADLPAGWTDEQEPSRYGTNQHAGTAQFAYGLGPQGWKRYLHPPEVRLFQLERKNGEFRVLPESAPRRPYAFLGVRACELAAIEAQDRVLGGGPFADPIYKRNRKDLFLIAVNCTRCPSTCFCASMGTGPRARHGFDLALTEVLENGRHDYLAEAGSERGREILAEIGARPAPPELERRADELVAQSAAAQSRAIDTTGIHELLANSFDHPRWDEIARRCLACGNCTMVCPTCFCSSVEDTSDLTNTHAARWQRWDSCFTQAFSYIHGGSVRKSVKSLYRQWLSHKLAYWTDQFGGSGCVGCGRCITWCPAGIDITEEVRAIRQSEPVSMAQSGEEDDGNT